jgi:hypothetical protein
LAFPVGGAPGVALVAVLPAVGPVDAVADSDADGDAEALALAEGSAW